MTSNPWKQCQGTCYRNWDGSTYITDLWKDLWNHTVKCPSHSRLLAVTHLCKMPCLHRSLHHLSGQFWHMLCPERLEHYPNCQTQRWFISCKSHSKQLAGGSSCNCWHKYSPLMDGSHLCKLNSRDGQVWTTPRDWYLHWNTHIL